MPREIGVLVVSVKLPDLLPRAITGIVLILLVFAGVFFLNPFYFALASGVVFLGAAAEWAKLSGFHHQGLYVLLVGVMMIICDFRWAIGTEMMFVATLLWVIAPFNFFRYSPLFAQYAGIIMLASAWKAINILFSMSPHPFPLLLLFMVVWLSDIVAYFVGSYFGKHKLAPSISPGKSVEGAVGAFVGVGIVAALIFHSVAPVILCLVGVGVSIIGDLFESLMKRKQNLKDSGKLLPGHGGILDRLDSLIAVAPLFAWGLMFIHL